MSAVRYQVDWTAELLHSFPHLDFSFQETNSTFDPRASSYKEALVVLALFPVACCVILLLLTCGCLCGQCCKQKPKKKRGTTCLRLVCAVFIIFSIGALAVGFFGNEEGNKGIQSTVDALQDTNDTVSSTLNTLGTINSLMSSLTETSLKNLEEIFRTRILDQSVRRDVLEKAAKMGEDSQKMRSDISYIRDQLSQVDFSYLANMTADAEFYRWIGTIVLCCCQVVVLLVYIVGTLKKSKCWLVWAMVLGFISIFFLWVSAGVYLAGDVALGDFCVDPNTFVKKQVGSESVQAIVAVYLDCKNHEVPANFSGKLDAARDAILKANTTLNQALKETLPYNISGFVKGPVQEIRTDLSYVQSNISLLSDTVYCDHIHTNYVKALNGVCNRAFIGCALILLVLPVMGLCLVFIQCLTPRIWLLLGKRKDYALVDNTDPFLPRGPPAYNDYQSMNRVDRRSTHEGGFLDDSTVMSEAPRPVSQGSDTPPPAYYASSYNDHYRDLGTFPTRAPETNHYSVTSNI